MYMWVYNLYYYFYVELSWSVVQDWGVLNSISLLRMTLREDITN